MSLADIIATVILVVICIAPIYFWWDGRRTNWYGFGNNDR